MSGRASSTDATPLPPLRRIPVRRHDDFVLVDVDQLAAVTADGDTLHLATRAGERYSITYRLHDLEARLDRSRFVRLSRSALVAVDTIAAASPMPGGTYLVTLHTGQQLPMSRLRTRVLRERLLRL